MEDLSRASLGSRLGLYAQLYFRFWGLGFVICYPIVNGDCWQFQISQVLEERHVALNLACTSCQIPEGKSHVSAFVLQVLGFNSNFPTWRSILARKLHLWFSIYQSNWHHDTETWLGECNRELYSALASENPVVSLNCIPKDLSNASHIFQQLRIYSSLQWNAITLQP